MNRLSVIVLSASILFLLFFVASPPRVYGEELFTIAVLPLQNTTGNPSHDFLCEGIAETIVTKLARLKYLQVVERLQVDKLFTEMKFSRSDYASERSALRMGRMLSASYVTIGSFQVTGTSVLVNARVVSVETKRVLFGFDISGAEEDVLGLQFNLAKKIADGIFSSLGIKEYTWFSRKEKLSLRSFKKLSRAKAIVDSLPKHDLSPMRFKEKATYRMGIDYLDEVLEESPNNLSAHIYSGILYQNLDDEEKACAFLKRAEKLAPDEPEVLFFLGTYHAIRREYDLACNYFNRALQYDPGHADSHYGLAKAYNRLKKKQEAIHHALKAMEYRPDATDWRRFLSTLLRGRIGFSQALTFYANFIRKSPGNYTANMVVGLVESDRGNFTEAYPKLQKALAGFPRMAEANYFMGKAWLEKKQITRALAFFKQALALYPAYPQANFYAGIAFQNIGKYEEAIIHYQNFITFSTDGSQFPKVRNWMERCKSQVNNHK